MLYCLAKKGVQPLPPELILAAFLRPGVHLPQPPPFPLPHRFAPSPSPLLHLRSEGEKSPSFKRVRACMREAVCGWKHLGHFVRSPAPLDEHAHEICGQAGYAQER